MNIGNLFAKTLSPNQSDRENATSQLEQFSLNDYPNYALECSKELANESQEVHLRTATGLALKNTLTAKEDTRLREYQNRWRSLPADLKTVVKMNVVSTLKSSELRASTAAAQCLAALATIEIPTNEWPELMSILLENVTAPGSSDNLRQSTLQAIGFICESIEPVFLESLADRILTAVVQGARKEEQNQNIRLAAINALYNSLDFIRRNFENSTERDFIMQVVCEATTSPDVNVVVASFECLVRIMSLYYDKMGVYMQQALFMLSVNGMRHEEPRVALQAVEFWSTICDVEMEIAEETAESLEFGEQPPHQSLYFAQSALQQVVPVLLWLLTKQEEDSDEDEWNPSMAAATCLSLFAGCVQDAIVGQVVGFVESNIRNADWRFREAAVMAFGSILDGPESKVLQPLVSQALPVIIEMMQDQVIHVKDTAAWTLGRICELHPDCIRSELYLKSLVEAILNGLKDTPRVAANCAWAFVNLSEQMGSDEHDVPTYPLSVFFEHIVRSLLEVAERQDANESNLRAAAYEALSSMLLRAPIDCLPHVSKVTIAVLERLEQSIEMESQIVGLDDRNQLTELQMSLCGVVQSFSRRLGREILPLADRIMVAFFRIFQSSTKTATTVEDVFLAIGVVINTLEGEFARYMDSFAPFLYSALQNHEEHQLCGIAVGIVGDLSRALGPAILPYCNNFMSLLSENLQSNILHRDVKPQILSSFGDIALAIMGQFEQYLSFAMAVLLQASQIQYDPNDGAMVEYVDTLFEGILEAYTGIVQGLKSEEKAAAIVPFHDGLFFAMKRALEIPDVSEPVVRAALGLLGDVASSVGVSLKDKLKEDWIEQVFRVAKGSRHYSAATKEVLKWSRTMVKKAVS